MVDDEEHVEQPELHSEYDEQVHRGDRVAVIPKEGEPGLARLRPSVESSKVARDRALGNVEAKHHELSVDPRRAPSVVEGHPADQVADLRAHGSSPISTTAARDPTPVQLEAGAMPPDDRIRLDDHQRVRPPRPHLPQHNPQRPVGGTDTRPLAPRLERRQLLSQHQVLQDQAMVRAEGRNESPEDDPGDAEHGRGTLLETTRKVNDHDTDGVLASHSFRLLRAHGIIRKIPRTHRYMLTQRGQLLTAALFAMRDANIKQLAALAA